jgi:DNA-binding CsgD family transcriptional regulator
VPPECYAPVSLWLDLIEARQLLAAGEPEAASDAMLDAAEVARRSGWRHPVIVPWADVAVEAHLAAGRPAQARAVLDDLERASAPLSARWPRAAIALARAGLAAAAGRLEEADAGFREALRVFEELPLPMAEAEALVSYGKHLRRTGRPREARLPLRQALALAERTGSERVARLARAELAASGGRRRRRDAHGASLTAQEERVARLAAQGMSNAQIAAALTVSPKTVDNHLQQIYAKLGIHSRRELTQRGVGTAG